MGKSSCGEQRKRIYSMVKKSESRAMVHEYKVGRTMAYWLLSTDVTNYPHTDRLVYKLIGKNS